MPEPQRDSTKGNWTRDWQNQLKQNNLIEEIPDEYRQTLYRPFTLLNCYFDDDLNQERYQLPKLFPNAATDNLVISVTGVGIKKEFSTLITNAIPDLQLHANGQCFPLHYFEERRTTDPSLFDAAAQNEFIRRDCVSDFILGRAKKVYGKNVGKEDIFYYVYGILHSPDYRTAFANDLKKMLPRIPLVEDVRDFWSFCKAGRRLADLHIGYEDVPPYEGVEVAGAESRSFKVEKMRFAKKDGEVKGRKRKVNDKSTIYYNSSIAISNIPDKAYEYVVNGRSAIEWIIDRYRVKTDPKSGIKNDPNDWAEEVGNPRYILDLLLSIINVSVQTVDIVEGLPKLEFDVG